MFHVGYSPGFPEERVTVAVSHTVYEKFDVKQSNDLEIWPRSSTVVSRESCRVAMYVKCSEDSERKKRKSAFSTTPIYYAPLQRTPANICINLYCQKLRSLMGYIFVADSMYKLCKFSNSFARKPDTPTH